MTQRRTDPGFLSRPLFTVFWTAQAVSLFGDRLHNFSLVALVNRFSDSPGTTLPLLYLAMYLPIFTLAPLIGALIERTSKRWLLAVTDLSRGALVFLIPVLFVRTGSFLPIMAVVFLLTTGNLFFVPAKSALIPELVPPHRLIRANAILWSAGVIGMIGGFLAGGLVFDYVTWQACFYVDGATYLFSAILLAGIALGRRGPARPIERPASAGLLASIREGFSAMRRSPAILRPIGVQSIVFFGAGGFSVLGVLLIGENFPPGSSIGLSVAGLAIGAGMGAGSIMANHIPPGRRRLFERSLFTLFAPAAAIFASPGGYVTVAAGSFLAGLATAPLVIVAESELQSRIGDGLRGIIFSFREILTRSLFVGSSFLFGLLSGHLRKGFTLTALGLFLATAGVFWFVVTERQARKSVRTAGGQDGNH